MTTDEQRTDYVREYDHYDTSDTTDTLCDKKEPEEGLEFDDWEKEMVDSQKKMNSHVNSLNKCTKPNNSFKKKLFNRTTNK